MVATRELCFVVCLLETTTTTEREHTHIKNKQTQTCTIALRKEYKQKQNTRMCEYVRISIIWKCFALKRKIRRWGETKPLTHIRAKRDNLKRNVCMRVSVLMSSSNSSSRGGSNSTWVLLNFHRYGEFLLPLRFPPSLTHSLSGQQRTFSYDWFCSILVSVISVCVALRALSCQV